MNSSIKDRIASFAIVWCMVFSLFAGLLVVAPSSAEAALPSFLENGDVIIGSDYTQSTWTLNLNGGTHYMDGNLTIRSGGTVTISNGVFAFTQDCGMDAIPGNADDHIYTLVVEDGGSLILNNATLTTHLDQIFNFPSLGVLVQNDGSIEATKTTFKFPGHIVVDDSSFMMTNSLITGHLTGDIADFCNSTYFDPTSYDDSAVFYAVSSTCTFVNSRVEKIFEGSPSANYYSHSYYFASDTAIRGAVTYSLARHVNSYTSANTAVGVIANLTDDDQKYVTVAPTRTLSIGSIALNGLVFPSSASYAIQMNVKYQTDAGFLGGNAVSWNYENSGSSATTIVPTNTHSAYLPNQNSDRVEIYTMPSMSSATLRNLNITFTNNDATASIHFNKIWFNIVYAEDTYRDITFGGSSSFTGIDSYLDVDFSNDEANHNQLNIRDAAKAYLYGVYGDVEEETNNSEREPAYLIEGITEDVTPISKNIVIDNTGGALSSLRAVDGSYYTIAQNGVMAIENFNVGEISGPIRSVTLSVSVRATSGYTVANYVQWGTSWGALSNTSIRPIFNGVTPDTYTYDLYSVGVKDISTLNQLKIRFENIRLQTVQFDRIAVIIETGPATYIYRWADVNAVDQQGLPISGVYVNATLLAGGAAAYYYTSSGVQSTPPSEVLSYLAKDSTNYKMTNESGLVKLPLLSEILNTTSQLPNMQVLMGYSLRFEYTNVSNILFAGTSTVAFDIYPAISLENTSRSIDFTMPGLFLDKPDLAISALSVDPAIFYVGDTATISVFVQNAALTGANNVAVNLTDSLSGWASEQIVPFIGPGSTVEVQFVWTAAPSGLHTFVAKADPKSMILEGNENNNDRSLQVNVLANLPELSVVTGDISFTPQPAYSGSSVTTTVVVSNILGRADASDVSVSFYIGDPTTSGQLIGSTSMNIARGTANTTSFTWTPTEIGTYNIFVYVNQGRSPQEYTYTNNLASRAIVVDLSIESTDLVVDDNDVVVFSGTDFNHRGRIIVMEQGTLIISNAKFTVDQDFDNQFQIYVMDSGRIMLENAEFTSTNSVWMYLKDNAGIWVNDSSLSELVKVKLDGTSSLSIDTSSIGAEIIAPTTSLATLTARDSSFTKDLASFGGSATATMYSVSIPSMSAKESSIIYHYRSIDVTVTDDANNIIAGAIVQLRWYVNGSVVETSTSGIAGKVSFDALCDVMTSSGIVYYGTFMLNCTYSFIGTTYYADEVPVSLQPYSSPLSFADPQVILVLNGVVPLSGWDLIISGTNVVTLEGTAFTHRGRIIIMDSGTLNIKDAGLTISQEFDYEFQIFVKDSGNLVMSGATLTSTKSIWVYASGNAEIAISTSTITSAVKISLADGAQMTVRNSTIGSDIIAPSGSLAVLKAYNTTFQTTWTAFGGNALAYLYGVSIPALRPIEGAVVLNYRWLEVQVLDGNNYPIPNAVVQMRYYLNGTIFDTLKTGTNGKVLFAALCDRIDASNLNFLGNYRLNSTYWYAGVAYETTAPMPVSLPPYSEPMVTQLVPRSLSIPGALPNLDPPLYASSSNPYRGDAVSLTTYVTNNGVVDANNVLVRFMDGSSVIVDIVVQKIVPGETATVRTTWAASYPLGQHNVSVIVDPFNTIKELNENDNTNWTLINIRGIADLYISAGDVTVSPSSPTTNSTTSVTLVVHNSGDVTVNNVNVSFVDIRPSGSQVLLGYRIIASIPGQEGIGSTSLSWVPNIPGIHNLLIRVNVGVPPVIEQTTTNNNVTYPVTVLNYADFTPVGVSFRPSSTIFVYDEILVDTAISNFGQSSATNVVVNFWEGAVGTGHLFDTETIAFIGAGQTVEVTGIWDVMPVVGPKIQTRTITIDVNPLRTITETDFSNNRLVQTVDVVDNRPDLMFVGGMNVTSGNDEVDEAVVGEHLLLKVTVRNDGKTPAMSVKIRFDAIDEDSFVTNIGILSRDIDAEENISVQLQWTVNGTLPAGNYTIRCTLDSTFAIDEYSENNNVVTHELKVDPPEPAIIINTDQNSYNPDDEVLIFGKVTNDITGDALANVKVVVTLVVADTHANVGPNITVFTNTKGEYSTSRAVPSNAPTDFYAAAVEVHVGDRAVTNYSAPFEVEAQAAETMLPIWIWILIIVLILVVIVVFSFLMYRKLGRLVECGECGALIPESSKKCPKCGVDFETGTAKCSQCGAWIPASSTECPECGVKFVTEPLAEEESEYIRKMREQYEAYVNPYREQGKQALGKKYSEAKFQEWWKKQASYMSFEKWLSQEEEKRKAAGTAFPCPVCGTLNPRGANICNKCGTVFDKAMMTEIGATAAEPSKPTRRIVKRPAEKKAAPKKEEGGEQAPEQSEEPKNQ